MSRYTKILVKAFGTAWFISAGTLVLSGQTQIKHLHKHHPAPVIINFQEDKNLSFDNAPVLKRVKANSSSKTLSIKALISKHLKAEVGISITGIQNEGNKPPFACCLTIPRNQYLSVPANIQYYPLPHHCKVQPYCGVGVQYNNHPFSAGTNASGENTANTPQSGTKYISIMFVQGVTYEINTKIQVTQSLHFIPVADTKVLGIGFGLGYTIP